MVSATADSSRIFVRSTDELGAIEPLAEVHLMRLVQEALSNIRKHAQSPTGKHVVAAAR
jgi:signal transduction histidine kinase